MGQSERHTATDRIIRNIQTEIITYQFHMVHDDHFMTIEIANEVNCVRLPDNWMDLWVFFIKNVTEESEQQLVSKLHWEWQTTPLNQQIKNCQ